MRVDPCTPAGAQCPYRPPRRSQLAAATVQAVLSTTEAAAWHVMHNWTVFPLSSRVWLTTGGRGASAPLHACSRPCRIGWPSAVRMAPSLTAPSSVMGLTLQVVPFTHAAGLLEWIDETTPLLDVLTGGKNYTLSLHGRHARPHDYSHVQCWKALADERSAPSVATLFARQQATFAKVSTPAWCLSLFEIFGTAGGRPILRWSMVLHSIRRLSQDEIAQPLGNCALPQ